MIRIAVCIITFRRPDGLKRLLDSLNLLSFKQSPPDLKIIVVDNDPDGAAQAICQEVSSHSRWELEYYIEPQQGIPYARNKCVERAISDTDFIAFIDDDEVPEPAWLEELLLVQKQCSADTVSGPVLPHFTQPIEEWKARFFERSRYPTGYLLKGAATNNVLVRTEIFKQLSQAFDIRFALSGGSDWHLFRRIYSLGYKIVWADTALVHEWIPVSRANIQWLLQRSYRLGNTESLCEIDLDPTLTTKLTCWVKGIRRIIIGSLILPFTMLQGKYRGVKTLRYIAHSFGMLAGTTGQVYEEYRKIHSV